MPLDARAVLERLKDRGVPVMTADELEARRRAQLAALAEHPELFDDPPDKDS